jgi:DNA-binding transcriptional LysR family regulator
MMVKLSELRVFLAAGEEESFSNAAIRLGLSQPAISQNIQQLEEKLGMELFCRQGRSVRLNEAGKALMPMAHHMITSLHRLEVSMRCLRGEVVGELAIGCSTSAGKYLIPYIGAAFNRSYANVQIRMNNYSQEEIVARLVDGRLPIGVVSREIKHQALDCQPFFVDPIILIVSPDHPLVTQGTVNSNALIDQPLIIGEALAGSNEAWLEGLSKEGVTRDMLRVVMDLGSAEAVKLAVEAGIGVGFVSKLSAARCLAAGRVCEVQVEGIDSQHTIYLVHNRQIPFTRAQSCFWNYVFEHREKFATWIWEKLAATEFSSKIPA